MHTIDQVLAFVSVFDHGSYSSSAKDLGKSRATIREHIHTYEDILGYELFSIEGKKATPTHNAKRLIKRARLLARQHRSLHDHGLNLFDNAISDITICIDTFTPTQLITETNSYIREKWPEINTHWLIRNREQSLQGLSSGDFDIAILPSHGKIFAVENATWRALGSVKFGVYTGKNSKLAKETNPTLEDLFLDTHILTESQVELGASLDGFRASPNSIVVSNNDLMFELIKNSGWGFMPKSYMDALESSEQIVELNVIEIGKEFSFLLHAFHLHEKDQEEPFSSVINFIRGFFSD
ncbi:LysR substrate-binding domain-containing protein [Photobacterium minamisatsumaniensis]|uniref:LysR substrate-binding domain-containing protein n=1 Tax=Photobacterium minamisatsumaniensis TaxID=2910233 RepID=UPI003D0EAE89